MRMGIRSILRSLGVKSTTCKVAGKVIERIDGENLIADKGYDSDKIREQVQRKNMVPIIPRKFNSKRSNPEYDKYLL